MQNTQIQQVNSNNTQLNTLIPQIHQIPLNQQQLYYSNFNQNYQFNYQQQTNQLNYQHQMNQYQSFQNFQNTNISWNTNYYGNQNNFNYITHIPQQMQMQTNNYYSHVPNDNYQSNYITVDKKVKQNHLFVKIDELIGLTLNSFDFMS